MRNPLRRDLDEILSHTADVWRALDGSSIFVTGGTGFYGCWLLESFAWAIQHAGLKAKMTVLSRSRNPLAKEALHLSEHPSIRFVRGDVRTFEYPEEPCTHVIHAATAAAPSSWPEDPKELASVIEDGISRTLTYAAESRARRCLIASSGAVYGRQPPELAKLHEDQEPSRPFTAYGAAKREAEEIAVAYSNLEGLQPVLARGFTFVGPYLPPGFAVSDFLRDGLRGGPISVKGDGTAVRSYLYASDLTVWLWKLLAFGESCRAYNVGSDREISIGELARLVADVTGASEVTFAAEPDPERPVERYVPDLSRIGAELGAVQTVDLDEALERTAGWLKVRGMAQGP